MNQKNFVAFLVGSQLRSQEVDSFFGPLSEELARLAIWPLLLSPNLDIPRSGRSEAKCARHVGDHLDQQLPALFERDFRRKLFDSSRATVLDQFDGGDRISRVELTVDCEVRRIIELEDVT